MQVSSPAFHEGDTIPRQFTSDGADRSPPLQWNDPPAGTASFAVLCEDPDAPRGLWVHWVLYDLPADARVLDEGAGRASSAVAQQGKNDFGNQGYGGPAPPRGKPHRYYFKVYALDTTLNLAAGASRADLLAAMNGHVVAEGQLMGYYARQ
jgi:Raf kinase inhibitor-like YbhB/YbcL family protein